MSAIIVTGLRSVLSWVPGKGGGLSHHYHEAPELGQVPTALQPRHSKALDRLSRLVEEQIPQRGYEIGPRTIMAIGKLESFVVRFPLPGSVEPPHLNCVVTYMDGDEPITRIDVALQMTVPELAELNKVLRSVHADAHAQLGLAPPKNPKRQAARKQPV